MKLDFDILSKVDFEEIWMNTEFDEINLTLLALRKR